MRNMFLSALFLAFLWGSNSLALGVSASSDEQPAVTLGAWVRTEIINPMSRFPTIEVSLKSNELIDLGAPFEGGQNVILTVAKVEGKRQVYVSLERGFLFCMGSVGQPRFRFDDGRAQVLKCDKKFKVADQRVILQSPGSAISAIQRSTKITVEVTAVGRGRSLKPLIVTFDPKGLVLP
jgi:hypothetical protein